MAVEEWLSAEEGGRYLNLPASTIYLRMASSTQDFPSARRRDYPHTC